MSHFINSCTIQTRSGRFCDRPSLPKAPFPICYEHSVGVYKFLQDAVQDATGVRPTATQGIVRQEPVVLGEPVQADVVYYLEWGRGRVKIGYTALLHQRLRQLSVPADQILAIEPGTQQLEKARHAQFKADRMSKSMEIFHHSKAVHEHIAQVRATHSDLIVRMLGASI